MKRRKKEGGQVMNGIEQGGQKGRERKDGRGGIGIPFFVRKLCRSAAVGEFFQ